MESLRVVQSYNIQKFDKQAFVTLTSMGRKCCGSILRGTEEDRSNCRRTQSYVSLISSELAINMNDV